jgi:hypothetical protein
VNYTTVALFLLLLPSESPGTTYRPLFTIERSLNANVVHYDAQIGPDGKFDAREPVVAYWILAGHDGRRQELNALERHAAYGFSIHKDGGGAYRMILVSRVDREIRIYREGELVRAEPLISGQRAYLQKIYVKTHRSVLVNTPEYAELFGIDAATGQKCYEKIPFSR